MSRISLSVGLLVLLTAPIHGQAAVARAVAMPSAANDPTTIEASVPTDLYKLIASDPASFADFGWGVAMSGDTMIVGAPGAGAMDEGAAYVFVRNETNWTQQAKLTASDAAEFERFGTSVALEGDTAIVGAIGDSVPPAFNSGAAYVFVRSGTTWTEHAKLTPSVPTESDHFGCSVALRSQTAFVGAMFGSSDGSMFDGVAYVFESGGAGWVEVARLSSPNPTDFGNFGIDVGISDGTAIVGAQHETVGAFQAAGAAHVFVRFGSTWVWQASLTASDPALFARVGSSVAIDVDTALAGADHNGSGLGSAYVFVRNGASWTEQAKLSPSDSQVSDLFGINVALSNDVALVGAAIDDTPSGANCGSAYVFTRSRGDWVQGAKLMAADAVPEDQLGWQVALDGDVLAASSPFDDLHALENAGSVHIFDLSTNEGQWTDLGSGLAGASGIPRFVGSGTLEPASAASLALAGAQPSAACLVHMSANSTPTPFKGGTLMAYPPVVNHPLVTSADGSLELSFHWPSGLPSASTLWFQVSIADPGAIAGVALSNAIKASTP